MEDAKEKWYEVFYNTKLDKLVLKKSKIRGGVFRKIRKHRLITTVILAFITFSILNITMIVSFFEILQKV